MRPETPISLAILSLAHERGGREVGFREDIVKKLQDLRSRNVPVSGIRFRPGIQGPTSEEVSDFVGRLAIAGYVVQESPIKLTAEGLELLIRHAMEHLSEQEVRQAAAVLGLDESALSLPIKAATNPPAACS